MSPLRRALRRRLGLPPRRCATRSTTDWLALSDGVRLATHVIRPELAESGAAPIVMIRTPRRTRSRRSAARFFADCIAESGYLVVLQECRGRGASEGRFEPFLHEECDAGETLAWIAEQPWAHDGDGRCERVGVVGLGYSGFAAWAALAAAPERVGALAVGFHCRDPFARFYTGGALQLDSALRFALACDERTLPADDVDLVRGLRHRPLLEADRVALRRSDEWRALLAHPRRDEYWAERTPRLPDHPPPSLLLAGWYDPSLAAQLGDHAALAKRGDATELVIGPWAGGNDVRARRRGRDRGALLRHVIHFLDRRLRGGPGEAAPVRAFTGGEGRWREFSSWPPPEAQESVWHLRSDRGTASPIDDGSLTPEAPAAGERAKSFRADPDDPVPSLGGSLASLPGPCDQRSVEARADVLCYTSAPLARPLVVAGPVRVRIHVASSAPDGDFCAKLVDVSHDASAIDVCDGIVRARHFENATRDTWFEGDAPRALEISLGASAHRFDAGHRIRLEIATASFPRFDRNPQSKSDPASAAPEESTPAKIRVLHDAPHPSRLVLTLLPSPFGAQGPQRKGPAGV